MPIHVTAYPQPGAPFLHLLCVPALSVVEMIALQVTLAPEELARAERYRFDVDRRTFIFARATLRRVLGACLGVEPHAVNFDYNWQGKPALRDHEWLQFNVAHTREAIAIALSHGIPIGVDIERVAPERAALDAASLLFAPAECSALAACPPNKRHELFFALWTLKEAYIKARGLGLSLPLDGFAFVLNDERIEFSAAPGEDVSRWGFFRGRTIDGHAWALALPEPTEPPTLF